jgi:hypothetical protein
MMDRVRLSEPTTGMLLQGATLSKPPKLLEGDCKSPLLEKLLLRFDLSQ